MAEVQAFDPIMVRELELMREQNNLYGSICQQEAQARMQITGLTKVIHDIKHNKIQPEDMIVPYGMGGYRRLHTENKKELLDIYLRQLEMEENKLKALNGQRLHRGDEVGEQRLKVWRMLGCIMTQQHNFTEQELFEHLSEYNQGGIQRPLLRPEKDVKETIKKAGEIIV